MLADDPDEAATAGRGAAHRRSVLVVDDDEMVRDLVAAGLEAAGMEAVTAADGRQALDRIAEAVPDLVISDINMPDLDGFALVSRLRADPATRRLTLIFLTSRDSHADVVRGLRLGADDYVSKPFRLDELIARVQAKLTRPPVPLDDYLYDPRTGLLSEQRFLAEATREAERARRSGRAGGLALFDVAERRTVRARLGPRAVDELDLQLTAQLAEGAPPLELCGRDRDGRFLLLAPETDENALASRLLALAERVARSRLTVTGEVIRITPLVGWVPWDITDGPHTSAADLLKRADTALAEAARHLDLRPVRWHPGLLPIAPKPPWTVSLARMLVPPSTAVQIAATLLIGLVLPFFVYVALAAAGFDITGAMFIVVVVALMVTATLIWTEGLLALSYRPPPATPAAPYPPATAIIATYLPNEAATILETVRAFLRLNYPAPLQIIVAYNTPRPLPVEEDLRALAAHDPRLSPYQVAGSTSKAQNVNAALSLASGEMVGVFDADHHPHPDAFLRAWRHLSRGYQVVQGHCVIRNGSTSLITETVAVEFETIYAVSHPGRTRLHGFGLFGGSNGYWRADALARTRMRGSMLTEDIDSSIRVVRDGGAIACDPGLLSRELAPTTMRDLWNQRMRWAQGWFQVSVRHLGPCLRSPVLSVRQKLGMFALLGWREVYPWLSLQVFPLLAFFIYEAGGVGNVDWTVPVLILTAVFTLSVGPGQTLFAWRLAAPELRRHRRWFWLYLVVASLAYTEFKNTIARVAQLKELTGQRRWVVTPRAPTGPQPPASTPGGPDAGGVGR